MAGHGEVSAHFLFHRPRKTANLIDNEIHVTAKNYFYFQTFCDSGKDCNFQAFCDSAKNILLFWKGEEINRR